MTRKDLLTPTEHEIMLHVWALLEEKPKFLFIRDVQNHYPEKSRPVYTTLSTFVKILQNKGYLKLSKLGNNINIQTKVSRAQYCERYLRHTINDFFAEDPAQMIQFILETNKLSDEQKEQVKEVLK